MSDFVHIHSHSQYSKFDGLSTVKGLVGAARKQGMSAVSLTDHGTVAGLIEFLKECRKSGETLPEMEDARKAVDRAKTESAKQEAERRLRKAVIIRDMYPDGIKPILGMEGYMSRNHKCKGKEHQPDGRKGNRHINVIAKDSVGFANLCSLAQDASLEGYYYDPRIDFELLDKYKEGLIVTSACLSNIVNALLLQDKYEVAKKTASQFKEVFGEDYYLEMMFHGIDSEAKILPGIQKLSRELDIKTIVTNDCHYVTKADAEFHDKLLCMSSGRTVRDPNRMSFPFEEFYFKSEYEMKEVFGHCERSMRNTLEIADKCDYSDIVFIEDGGEMRLPKFPLPVGETTPYEYLEKLAWAGLEKEGWIASEPHIKRLERELSDTKLVWDTERYDFSTYYLIVEDIMTFARKKGIAGGIRGSGYGSLLLKCLGITEGVDPLEYELLWERFQGFDEKFFISEEDFGCKSLTNKGLCEDKEDK